MNSAIFAGATFAQNAGETTGAATGTKLAPQFRNTRRAIQKEVPRRRPVGPAWRALRVQRMAQLKKAPKLNSSCPVQAGLTMLRRELYRGCSC